MITVEVSGAGDSGQSEAEVEIFCDAEGLALLSRQLDQLKSGSSHVHLMTPAWAGDELGETPFGRGTLLINHLRITMVPAHGK